jgi:hypothetical protein
MSWKADMPETNDVLNPLQRQFFIDHADMFALVFILDDEGLLSSTCECCTKKRALAGALIQLAFPLGQPS